MSFKEKLRSVIDAKKSHLCIGLDLNPEYFPKSVLSSDDPFSDFNRQIIENTEDITSVYKLNLAFYEALGHDCHRVIKETLAMIPDDALTIADAKRGDIGTSSEMYAKAIFNEYGFDAITVSPYMGFDSLKPFADFSDKGVFSLVLTSNSGAKDFQYLNTESGKPLYIEVAEKLSVWNENENFGMVLGATHISELKAALEVAPNLPCLIPGVGNQGGDAAGVRDAFRDIGNELFIVNSSRGIIYASNGDDFASEARAAAITLRDSLI